MKPPKFVSFLIGVAMVLFLAGAACADEAIVIKPGTQKAAAAISQLEQAERIDRANSTSWTDTAPGLDHYYARKAGEAHHVLMQLKSGEAVSSTDVSHALETSEGNTFGATY